MNEFKPTKEQLLQAMEDQEDGKPLTAEMRAVLNRHRIKEVEVEAGATSKKMASMLDLLDILCREPPPATL